MAEVRMSLREASQAIGIPANTLRSRYKAGKLRGERDNAGRLFVWIDPTAAGSKSSSKTNSNSISKNSKKVLNDGEIEALKGQILLLTRELEIARTELASLRDRAREADRFEAQFGEATKRSEELAWALDHAHEEKMILLTSLVKSPKASFWQRLFGR